MLSIADLLYILTTPLLITTFHTKTWIFGPIICKAFLFIETANKYASVAFLLCLSWDRHLAVCYPISGSRFRTRKYTFATVVMCWTCVLVLVIPQYIYGRSEFIPGINRTVCAMFWPGNATKTTDNTPAEHYFIFTTFALVFVLPTLLICTFYAFSLAKLHLSNRMKSKYKRSSDGGYIRATQLILAAIMIHTICWGPYWFFSLIHAVAYVPMNRWKMRLYNFILMLPHVNSAINPILYGVLNRNYRGEFRTIFSSNKTGSIAATSLSSTVKHSQTLALCEAMKAVPITSD